MRTTLYLIRKEFLQIFRNKFISKAIFAVPIVQMLLLVPAVTFEIKNVDLCVVDMDLSTASRSLITRLEGSSFFRVNQQSFSLEEAQKLLHRDQCDMILHIPTGFGRDLVRDQGSSVMVSANAINASTAQLSWAYLNGVLRDYNMELIAEMTGNSGSVAGSGSITGAGSLAGAESAGLPGTTVISGKGTLPEALPRISITNRYWYNELLTYSWFMLPGILGILITAIGFVLAGLNLVREKEVGTIEQINVTPVKKVQFMASKMIPFLLIGLIDLALGLAIGRLVFHIPFEGSAGLLFLGSAIYLVAVLGLALFVSTFSSTQQQFMFVAFFLMILFILMSGVFTPVESMPLWAQKVNLANPLVYLMRINRMVMLKGSGFGDIIGNIGALLIIAALFMGFAVRKYRKTA